MYEYDFGDGWQHELLLEEVLLGDEKFQQTCVADKRCCPPEDCGGPQGFAELLQVLQDVRSRAGRGQGMRSERRLHAYGVGKSDGTLTLTDNASSSPQVVPLSDTGAEAATLTPTRATCASQAVGTTSAAKTFTLTNNQSAPLTSIVITTSGDFAMSATTCTTSLAAESKCTTSLTFTPTATGKRTGQPSVSDSASNNPQTSTLTGTGN